MLRRWCWTAGLPRKATALSAHRTGVTQALRERACGSRSPNSRRSDRRAWDGLPPFARHRPVSEFERQSHATVHSRPAAARIAAQRAQSRAIAAWWVATRSEAPGSGSCARGCLHGHGLMGCCGPASVRPLPTCDRYATETAAEKSCN